MNKYLVLLLLTTTVTLPQETSTTKDCVVDVDSENNPVSCRPCNIGTQYGHEVHVRNIATTYTGTAKVSITLRSGVSPRPLRLLLISQYHVDWKIDTSATTLVEVDKAVTMASDGINSTLTTTRDFKLLKPTHIHRDTTIMNRDPKQAVVLLQEKGLGEMTSYQADFSGQAAFDIILGSCDQDILQQIVPSATELQCLADPKCLIEAPFVYSTQRTDCTGKSYITQYDELYVGIVLCSNSHTRYKLFLSNLLSGPYLDIADRVPVNNYYGADHCQVIGQNDETMPKTSHTFSPQSRCDNGYGFFREHINQDFLYGKICGDTYSSETYTGRVSPSWYECGGVTIPGNFKVVEANWQQPTADLPGGPDPPTLGSVSEPPQQGNMVSIIVPSILGVIVTLVVISLAVVFYRRHKQQQRDRSPAHSLTPRRESQDCLQDRAMDIAIRPPAEPPLEALQEAKYENEDEYCYVYSLNEPPKHQCPLPPCNDGLNPSIELQKSNERSVPNVYTQEGGNQRLHTNVHNSEGQGFGKVPKIQTDEPGGPRPEGPSNVQGDNKPGYLNVPTNPHIPSAPNTPTPVKKSHSPQVAKKPPKSPGMPQKIIIPGSPKVMKKPDVQKLQNTSDTGIIATAVHSMAPTGFMNELVRKLPNRAPTAKVSSPYDNKYIGDEGEYIQIFEKSNSEK